MRLGWNDVHRGERELSLLGMGEPSNATAITRKGNKPPGQLETQREQEGSGRPRTSWGRSYRLPQNKGESAGEEDGVSALQLAPWQNSESREGLHQRCLGGDPTGGNVLSQKVLLLSRQQHGNVPRSQPSPSSCGRHTGLAPWHERGEGKGAPRWQGEVVEWPRRQVLNPGMWVGQ